VSHITVSNPVSAIFTHHNESVVLQEPENLGEKSETSLSEKIPALIKCTMAIEVHAN
jgi:hypothetical protein